MGAISFWAKSRAAWRIISCSEVRVRLMPVGVISATAMGVSSCKGLSARIIARGRFSLGTSLLAGTGVNTGQIFKNLIPGDSYDGYECSDQPADARPAFRRLGLPRNRGGPGGAPPGSDDCRRSRHSLFTT